VIRITTNVDEQRSIVAIAGQLTDSDVKEIRRVRKSISGEVLLSLRGLDTCSGSGITFLREWLGSGARLQDATPFLEIILQPPPTGGSDQKR
jgi:hypothetical protein